MKTLWFDEGRRRCFLVPDDTDLPGGDLVLRTSIGRRLEVDAGAVAPFEVTRGEAAAWSKEQLKGLLGGKKQKEATKENPDDAPLPLFSALAGESADDLRSDPEALKRGLRQVGAKLGAVLKDATSVSPQQRQRAEAQLDELRAAVAEAEAAKERAATVRAESGGSEKASDAGAAAGQAQRQAAETALRSVADLVGSLGRAAEQAGARFAAAADELKAQRQAAQAAAGGEAEMEDGPDDGAGKEEEG